MQNLLDDLKALLSGDDRLLVDGELMKNKVIELALQLDQGLIKALLSCPSTKKHFFQDVDSVMVFDKIKFQRFVANKTFLPDSYTAFKNKIGLITESEDYLLEKNDVVLTWPYKDCVLEGGQNKDDQKRSEIFWNETLAPDEIDRLLSPKVLSGFKYCGNEGERDLTSEDEIDIAEENLLIKGNNLLALCSLRKRFAGEIKLIYIDPPYNPDSRANTFCYNNTFNESTWLTFMKNRLDIAKQLLRKDGVLIVAIDENEHVYLGLLLKEIFKNYEIHCITIVHNPRGVQGNNFSYTHEYAFFVLPAGKKSVGKRKIDEANVSWSNLRNWGGESRREDAKNCFYAVIVRNEKVIGFGDVLIDDKHPAKQTIKKGDDYYVYPIDSNGIERKWRYARQSVEEVKNLLKAKKIGMAYEIEIGKDFGTYKTVWIDSRYDANEYGTKIVKDLVPGCKFDFPKSLYNVYDCVHSIVSEDKNAIVLDFFAGSGTTAHAVIELNKEDGGNRRFILCEQMDYIESVTKERIKKVMKNNKSGSFVYCKLAAANQEFIDKIEKARNNKELRSIWEKMKEMAFISYRVDVKAIDENNDQFEKLSIDNQKKFLIETLEKNLLYINLSDLNDKDYHVSKEEKEINQKFYSLK